MLPLPLPVRIAAGLVATAVEQVKDLPRLVVEFPVTAVSQALQASMRVQQKVTELAIKGDRALGTLSPVEEQPSWARFDDEEEPPRRNGTSSVTALRPQPVRPAPSRIPVARTPEPPADTAREVAAETTAAAADGASGGTVTPGPSSEDVTGPNVLPGYGEMTIPQLRARLRKLSLSDLRTLLEFETAHENRPPYVTMLTNRITTVTQG